MQVTGGKARGAHLKTLRKRSVRPTTGTVRQAVFSLLDNSAATWGRVLDLYAGSGALGIEALSRDAEWVDFVEYSKNCCDIIRANLKKIGEAHRAHVYCCNVNKAIAFLENSYDVVFADPPYSDASAGSLLTNLASSRLLARNSTVVLSHGNRFPLQSAYDGLRLVKERRYGDSYISIYQKEA